MTERMREAGLVKADWELMRRNTRPASESGHAAVIVKGEAYWSVSMEWKFPRKQRANFMLQSSQIQKLEGGVTLIELWRPQRRSPLAFDASGPFGTVTAISANTGTREADITCGGDLGEGDMVSWDIDANGNRFLGEIVEVVSRPAVNQTVFKTQPRVLAVHSTPNAAVFQAHGFFQIDPGSVTIDEPIGLGKPATIRASFKQVTP